MCATVTALLGQDNPFTHDSTLSSRCWDYESALPHFFGLVPWLTAPKSFNYRKKLHQDLIQYYTQHKYDAADVSALIKETNVVMSEKNWSVEDRAAVMVVILQAALFNTIPVFYWFFCHVMINPVVVDRLREEAATVVTESASSNKTEGHREVVIDITDLESLCPLVVGAFRENQCLVVNGTVTRVVISDTVLSRGKGHSYFLKKDSLVQSSQYINHYNENSWGSDAGSFDAEIFVEINGEVPKLDTTKTKCTFIPFGGGKHLYPGRNFSLMENWINMIVFLLGFNITGPTGEPLTLPQRAVPKMTEGTGKPLCGRDLRCRVVRRKAGRT